MKRGDLSNVPLPVAHLDWRVVLVPPDQGGTAWQKAIWRWVFEPAEKSWMRRVQAAVPGWLKARLLDRVLHPRKYVENWVLREARKIDIKLIVVGPATLATAVERVVRRYRLWVQDVVGFETWTAYATHARQEAPIELVFDRDHPPHGDTLTGIRSRLYTGFGHRLGDA